METATTVTFCKSCVSKRFNKFWIINAKFVDFEPKTSRLHADPPLAQGHVEVAKLHVLFVVLSRSTSLFVTEVLITLLLSRAKNLSSVLAGWPAVEKPNDEQYHYWVFWCHVMSYSHVMAIKGKAQSLQGYACRPGHAGNNCGDWLSTYTYAMRLWDFGSAIDSSERHKERSIKCSKQPQRVELTRRLPPIKQSEKFYRSKDLKIEP